MQIIIGQRFDLAGIIQLSLRHLRVNFTFEIIRFDNKFAARIIGLFYDGGSVFTRG